MDGQDMFFFASGRQVVLFAFTFFFSLKQVPERRSDVVKKEKSLDPSWSLG